MGERDGIDVAEGLVAGARDALGDGDGGSFRSLAARLSSLRDLVTATQAVDLLERAACLGGVDDLDALWDAFDGDFAYPSFALCLALRHAREDVARDLLARGVDLLGEVRVPRRCRGLLPPEGRLTRFALTRRSPTLFLNNMDPTLSTDVFGEAREGEQLEGAPFGGGTDLGAACDLVGRLAGEGLFDPVAFDDLFRAAAVRAWHALRHAGEIDEGVAGTCLGLCSRMVDLHLSRGMGDDRFERVMSNLVVPRASRRMVEFVCREEPEVFFRCLDERPWLQDDPALVSSLVPTLSPSADERLNGRLLGILAGEGDMEGLRAVSAWPRTMGRGNVTRALGIASKAGHAEAAAWLLGRLRGSGADAPATGETSDATRSPAAMGGGGGNAIAPLSPTATLSRAGDPDATRDTVPEANAGDECDAGGPSERDALALQVLDLARSEVIASHPFLAGAVGLSPTSLAAIGLPFRTDGTSLLADPDVLLRDFARSRTAPSHDYAHVLAHCLLLHPFVGRGVDPACWDLACDLVAEDMARELMGHRPGERGQAVDEALDEVARELGPSPSAERIYRRLVEGGFAGSRERWARILLVDDHSTWHRAGDRDQEAAGSGRGEGDGASPQSGPQGKGEGRVPEDGRNAEGKPSEAGAGRDAPGEGGAGGETDGAPQTPDGHQAASTPTESELQAARERWERAGRSVRVDLQTLSRKRGTRLGGLVHQLEVSDHEQVDYREFLRQFATSSEELHVSDDEFDYVFYTYGLSLYGDTPLIEPLEYRDERRIRDFVIVIDTSSSVTHEVVQAFVDATYDVLASESSFSQRVNVHIVQADQRVQSDTKITSLADLDRWRRQVKLRGLGGTDFRPAFRYVNELAGAGEFSDLAGLIYFTDGWGIYPTRMPPYKTAFVFYDEDHRPELVPPWAIQLTLRPGEFRSMSVY